jgi:DNA polymerase-3 subunit delta
MIIFLYGSDAFRAREKLEELKRRFLEKNNGNEFLISVISADNFNIAEFRNKVLSAGFFAEKKMVILKNFLSLKSKDEPLVLEIVKKTPEDTVLAVWETADEADFSKSELFKFLSKQKYVYKFSALAGNDLITWIRERAKTHGAAIDNTACHFICDILGNDLQKIDLELQKMCCFVGSGCAVSQSVVEKMLTREAEENIFRLIDALAVKNKRLALLYLKEEFDAGASELSVLGSLSRQVRILLQTKVLQEKGRFGKEELAKELAIHPYVAQKSLAQEKNFHINELKNIYRRLMQVDMAIKSGGAPAGALFELIIAKL